MEFLSSLQVQHDRIEKQKQLKQQLFPKDVNNFVCLASKCTKSFAREELLDIHHKHCPHLLQESNVGLGAAAGSYFTTVASSSNSNNSHYKKRRNGSVKKTKTKHRNNTPNGSLSTLVAHTGPASVKKVNSNHKAAAAGRRRNSGETFKCPHCRAQDGVGKLSFTTKGALTRHNNEKHAQKHYECDICRKTFARKYRLKTHYISHHAIHLSPSDLKLKAVSNVSYGQPAMNTHLNGSDATVLSESTASMLKKAYKTTPSTMFFKRKGVDGYEHKVKRAKKNPEIDDVQAAWDLLGMMHCM